MISLLFRDLYVMFQELINPTDQRIFVLASALKAGYTIEKLNKLTNIDSWFLNKFKNIIDVYDTLETNKVITIGYIILRSYCISPVWSHVRYKSDPLIYECKIEVSVSFFVYLVEANLVQRIDSDSQETWFLWQTDCRGYREVWLQFKRQ